MTLVGFQARNHPQQRTVDDVDDRVTTAELFDPLHERHNFTVDVAAAPHNAKLPRYYTRAIDGLSQPWAGERVRCNPPYSTIRPWVEKAWHEIALDPHPPADGQQRLGCPYCDGDRRGRADRVVMLLPANRTEQPWWQELVEPHRDRGRQLTVEFLPGRIRFLAAGAEAIGPNERPPFGCCLLTWRRS